MISFFFGREKSIQCSIENFSLFQLLFFFPLIKEYFNSDPVLSGVFCIRTLHYIRAKEFVLLW